MKHSAPVEHFLQENHRLVSQPLLLSVGVASHLTLSNCCDGNIEWEVSQTSGCHASRDPCHAVPVTHVTTVTASPQDHKTSDTFHFFLVPAHSPEISMLDVKGVETRLKSKCGMSKI